MESFQSQDGQPFIRAVAQYIRQHEKALANSLQLTVQRRKPSQNGTIPSTPTHPANPSHSSTGTLAAALSFAGLNFKSHSVKSAQLTLTPHHLFYLLSRVEELDVNVGPMNVRIESIHSDSSPANYISFLQTHKTQKGRSDADSIHSVSSVRSVMSGMSALWSSMGLSTNPSKSEKARLALENDIKYIYGAFTKLPSLRLTPDHRTPLIKGYEQFPFDTAVPLFAFKNVQQLEIIDLDFRSFHGWDRLAEQLCLLTIKRGNVDDPIDLLESIVLDDVEKRRKRSNRSQGAPSTPSWSMPSTPQADYARSHSDPGSPQHATPSTSPAVREQRESYGIETTPVKPKKRSQTFVEGASPKRPAPVRPTTSYRHTRTYSSKAKRSGSGSSNSSDPTATPSKTDASAYSHSSALPISKWQRLVYLSLADNGMTILPTRSIQALVPSLRSFNLSSNLFTEIPDSLATLSRLVSLDLSNCMIDSLQTLMTHPLPAITTLKLKSNRLQSLVGIERLPSLENLHVQDNLISDPDEAARLAQIPNFKNLWIKHNPLTKRFSDYRVKIMNHFRRVSGFIEDIVIDDHPATYSERKLLVDRAVEPEQPASARHDPEARVVIVQDVQKAVPVVEATNKLSTVTMHREPSAASNLRKKGTRRRIVDLSHNESLSVQDFVLEESHAADDIATSKLESIRKPQLVSASMSDKVSPTILSVSPDPLPNDMARTLTDSSQNGDEYRRNVEELRMKFGNSWLSALGEQHTHWQSESDLPNLSYTHTSRPPPPPPKLHHYHSTPPVLGAGGTVA